jgi:putative transposase
MRKEGIAGGRGFLTVNVSGVIRCESFRRIMETKLPNRQSIRMKGWNYATPGHYFVTCNTHGSRALFGVIVNGRMVMNEAGRVAEECWRESASIRDGIELDEFVVMPNHVHGIVRLKASADGCGNVRKPQFGKPISGALGTFVGAYKAAVTREVRRRGVLCQRGLMHQARPFWHRNYWDVIVRDERALSNIRQYIRSNPRNYEVVMNVGEPRVLGNKGLLGLPKMGFLASRGEAAPHGRLPVKSGEAILSGFLSPMEREVFNAGLKHGKPMIWVKPWGLDETSHTAPVRKAIENGRLLVVSPFADHIEAPSVRRAAWCNQYVLAHSGRVVIGHLNPDGMLACVLSEADPETEVLYL